MSSLKYIRWFEEIGNEDIASVGGKNASLGEMYTELTKEGVKIPNGFAITSDAYWHVVRSGDTLDRMKNTLEGFDKNSFSDLATRGKKVRELILNAGIPDDLWKEIQESYDKLCEMYGPDTDVAVRSSATAEDLPTASFAGQQESYLNIRGYHDLREVCSKCFASLFTDRGISYRIDKKYDHFEVGLSIGVMKMVRSDLASSGVIFTLDTETGFRDVVFVTGSYGLGENIVLGAVNPDEFYVFKPTARTGHKAIVRKNLGDKKIKMIYGQGTSKVLTRNVEVPESDSRRFCITDDEILVLARYAIRIEDHYSQKAHQPVPMDIEWAKDGVTGELFIVQARPETVHSQDAKDVLLTYYLEQRGPVLSKGKSVGEKIASGKARVIADVSRLHEFLPGEILVSDTTNPDWEPVMKTASAIVTNRGGRTCHAAIVSRELGLPAVVGTNDATEKIRTGQDVTVNCAEGDVGVVYEGILPFHVEKVSLTGLRRPKTKIMMNLGEPDQAFAFSMIPNDGIGLARMEFVISNYIKIHPMALVHPEKVTDENVKTQIGELTYGAENPEEYFVGKLAQGIGTIAAAFYPKPVVVRMSDFKTNEYANLLGGSYFEPREDNPMLGFRGASRYYDEKYREGFALECRAMKRVREEMGLSNLIIMIPFCRRVDEAEKVMAEMAKNGLVRGENGLEIYVMCEIPNNILLIQGARRNGRDSGICGQAPSDFPEFAEFLVREGIDSISLNPDSVMKITRTVVEMEERLDKQRAK